MKRPAIMIVAAVLLVAVGLTVFVSTQEGRNGAPGVGERGTAPTRELAPSPMDVGTGGDRAREGTTNTPEAANAVSGFASDPPADPNNWRVTGRVYLPNGDGAPNAEVEVQLLSGNLMEAMTSGSSAAEQHATDAEGRFSFTIPRGSRSFLVARLEGYGPAHSRINVPPHFLSEEQDGIERIFRLGELSALQGIVTDEAGDPIQGAAVQFLARPGNALLADMRTGADGSFELPASSGSEGALIVVADGYTPESRLATPPQQGLVIRLSPADAVVIGRVTWRDSGAGAGGVRLTASPLWGAAVSQPSTWTGVTGADGAYRLEGLPRTYLFLKVEEESGRRVLGSASVQVNTRGAGDAIRQDFVVYTGHTLRGRVVDRDSREPVAGATVTALGRVLGPVRQERGKAVTASDGSFEIGELSGEAVTLLVDAPGMVQVWTDRERRDIVVMKSPTGQEIETIRRSSRDLRLEADELELETTLFVSRMVAVRGRVVDEVGNPMTDAMVGWVNSATGRQVAEAEFEGAKVDNEGRFELASEPSVTGGVEVRFDDGYTVPGPVISVGTDAVEGVEVVVRRRAVLGGEVVTDDGKPVPLADVFAMVRFDARGQGYSKRTIASAMTGSDGRFLLTNVPPGDVELRVSADELEAAEPTTVVLTSGERRLDLRIVLTGGTVLGGTVVDPDGNPINEATVFFISPEGRMDQRRTDGEGRFRFTGVRGERVELFVAKNSSNERFPNIATGREDHRLVFEEKEQMYLVGTVLDAGTREPVTDFQARMDVPGIASERAGVAGDAEGRFRIPVSPGNQFPLRIDAPGYAPLLGAFIIVPRPLEENMEEVFLLHRGGVYTGRIVGARGEPLGGVELELGANEWRIGDGEGEWVTTSGDDGRFEIGPVSPGRYVLQATPGEGYQVRRFRVSMPEEEARHDLGDLELSKGATIVVSVLDAEDVPMADHPVVLQPGWPARDTNPIQRNTGTDGVLVADGLEPGSYDVSLPGQEGGVQVEQIGPDETREVTLVAGERTLVFTVLSGGESVGGVAYRIGAVRNGMATSGAEGTTSTPGGKGYAAGLAPIVWTVTLAANEAHLDSAPLLVEQVDLTTGNAEKTFRIAAASVTGTVWNAEGDPVGGATVTFHTGTEETGSPFIRTPAAYTGEDGVYTMGNLAPGVYTVRAAREGESVATVEVEAGATVSQDFTLEEPEKGTLVSVALRLTDGNPIQEAWLRVREAETGVDYSQEFRGRDTLGVGRLDLPAGSYNVVVSTWGHSEARRTVEILAGEETLIEDVLYEAGSMKWAIADATGAPAAGVEVSLAPDDPNSIETPRTGVTDRNGFWEQRGLFPGVYTARALAVDGRTATARFTIAAHEHTERVSPLE